MTLPPIPIPARDGPDLDRFCEDLVPGGTLRRVNVNPPPWAQVNDCVRNVPSVIAEFGGNVEYGWQLWERPGVLLEAEFHAVWIGDDERRVDVTPKQLPWVKRIAFLPDPSLRYEGRQIDTRRLPLQEDPLIEKYITAAQEFFEMTNYGQLADFHGELHLTAEMRSAMARRDLLEAELMDKYSFQETVRCQPPRSRRTM